MDTKTYKVGDDYPTTVYPSYCPSMHTVPDKGTYACSREYGHDKLTPVVDHVTAELGPITERGKPPRRTVVAVWPVEAPAGSELTVTAKIGTTGLKGLFG